MIDGKWIDKHGFVKTKIHQESTGNGALYSTISWCLGCKIPFPFGLLWDYDRGVLMRTPNDEYGQESHDNYLAIGVYCIKNGEPLARSILWSAIKKFGFMQNSFEKGDLWKSQMFRFPHVWIVMIAAAFPNRILKWLACRASIIIGSFSRVDLSDASGAQLQWLVNYSIVLMGDPKPMKRFLMKLRAEGTSMSKIMIDQGYWEHTPERHPVLDGYDRFEEKMIG